jgi:hypothetical protein
MIRVTGSAAFVVVFVAACKDPPSPPTTTTTTTTTATATSSATPAAARVAPLPGFAGFSKDGKTFGYVDRSGASGMLYTKTITVGADWPKQEMLDGDVAGGGAALAKDDYVAAKPVPEGITFTSDLTAKPPKLTLKRGDKSVDVKLPSAPFPPADRAELIGSSADGKTIAVHIAGPDVPGVFSKGGGGVFHFVYIAPAP